MGSMTASAHRLRPGLLPRRWSHDTVALDSMGRRLLSDRPGLIPVLRALESGHSRDHIERLIETHAWDTSLDTFLAELERINAIDTPAAQRLRVRVKHDRQTEHFVRLFGLIAEDHCNVSPYPEDTEDVVVMIAASEPPREMFRTLMTARVPHVLVVFDADVIHVGPFVVPGVSPCVDCFDLHQGRWHPEWPLVVAQTGGPPPLRLGASRMLQASAAQTLVSWLADKPAPSIRVTLGPRPADESRVRFRSDPSCPCSFLAPLT